MKRPWAILPLVASSSIYCGAQSGPRVPGGEDAPPSLLVRTAPASAEVVAFPPAPSNRRARGAMPQDFSEAREDGPPRVVEPALDGDASIDMVEGKLKLVFSAPMARPKPPKPDQPVVAEAGTFRFTPDLPGVARWIDGHTVEFVATTPPAIGKTFALELGPAVKGADGAALAQPVKAKAIARASVGGKVLTYVPQMGLPRVVVVRPNSEKAGRMPKLSALFDQPIELSMAKALLRLEDSDGKPVPFVVDHPKSPSFEGIRLDPRFVVLASPRQPLKPGATYTFKASDRVQPVDSEPKSAQFEVAEPLKHADVKCGWSESDGCEITNKRVRTASRELHVLYNNPLSSKDGDLRKNVTITPAVKNLYVRTYGYDDGRVIISGAFEPSTRYSIQVGGIVDVFGGKLPAPTQLTLETAPVGASATMPEGVLTLDQETSKKFRVVSRNVEQVELSVWPVARDDAAALEKAIARVRTRDIPSDTPAARIKVVIKPSRDQLVETPVDLLEKLTADRPHLVALRVTDTAYGADLLDMPRHSEATRMPVALVTPASPNALAVHARTMPDATLVHVARLASGEPVAGASISLLGGSAPSTPITTNADGVALLRGSSGASWVRVAAKDSEATLSLSQGGTRAKNMFPELGIGAGASASPLRGVLLTDRGIYRPGSTLFAKTFVKKLDGERLVGASDAKVRVEIVGPTGEQMTVEDAKLDASGGFATRVAIPGDAKLGRYQINVQEEGREDAITQQIVQVADFEPPRFAVDVDAAATADRRIDAKVRARYLFGAPMDGGSLSWTLKRESAPIPRGAHVEAGLTFSNKVPSWYEDKREQPWIETGDAKLAPDGTFAISRAVPVAGTIGPQLVTLEADVSDSSHRHIANRGSVVLHTAARYAGLRVKDHWLPVGTAFPVELGVVDHDGKSVEGVTVSARVTRIDYRYVTRRGAGGALRTEWTTRRSEAGRCSVKSAKTAVSCNITLTSAADYEISAEVDGSPGGSVRVFAWSEDERTVKPAPRRGRAVEVVADKSRYVPGETAKLMVHSPFAAATAILTVEQGGLLSHQTLRVQGSMAKFEVPITPAHAPHVHAAVTLLPAAKGGGRAPADYRIGAVRLPVTLAASRLDLALGTAKSSYAPGDEAEVQIEVRDAGQPQANADVVLAVVDEGVLRLTNFKQPDPVAALRPGRALEFEARDSREALADLLERSHVAGDGGGETVSSARKSFVETALWRPDIKTDASGRATVRFKLPDNLTEFRVMALAIDDEGKGITGETAFTVKKPVMVVPVVPRFAAVGDRFEAAAMVHNETDRPIDATVSIADRTSEVNVPAHAKTRVGFSFVASGAAPQMVVPMSVRTKDGPPLDSVEVKIPVQVPGIAERPQVEGSFAKHQQIELDVPEDVLSEAGTEGTVKVTVGQHVWPELGARLGYLLGYPHGCVEQTTSSTLPLLAARDILPRIGVSRWGDGELKHKIEAGLERLATMKTPGGGLGYWPGDDTPNIYGTAYAMRAVVLAKRSGIAAPRGLAEGMRGYLADHLVGTELEPEVQAAIAQSLAELGELPASAADALFDRREQQTAFGLASLALALSTLPSQNDRVARLLDDLEASFDGEGKLVRPATGKDFHYFGSNTRTMSQAAMALTKLRRGAKVLPRLLSHLADDIDSYTTQATAYSLLALAQHLTDTRLGGADVRVLLDGAVLAASRDLGHGSREYAIPLASLRGKHATLRLESAGDDAMGFAVSSSWRRPAASAKGLAATASKKGPEIWRVYTDAKGKPVDLATVRAGDVLRVALVSRMPQDLDSERRGYLALTDRLPAGFEPIQPDLATVASVPELDASHPLVDILRWSDNTASHVEMHDDRVDLYFDRIWGGFVAATYLVRATTPGTFLVPAASAELMYEGDSHGYTETAKVIVQ